MVIIAASVTVVGLIFLIVKKKWGAPKSRSAEVSDIVKMVNYALEIASVAV